MSVADRLELRGRQERRKKRPGLFGGSISRGTCRSERDKLRGTGTNAILRDTDERQIQIRIQPPPPPPRLVAEAEEETEKRKP